MPRQFPAYLFCSIRAVVVDDDNLVNVIVIHLLKRIHERSNVHLFVVAGQHDGNGAEELGMTCKIHSRTARILVSRLFAPYIKGPAKLANDGCMLQDPG